MRISNHHIGGIKLIDLLIACRCVTCILDWTFTVSMSSHIRELIILATTGMWSMNLRHIQLKVFPPFHLHASRIVSLDRRFSVEANPCCLLLDVILLHGLAAS